jgi:hypothetical protein
MSFKLLVGVKSCRRDYRLGSHDVIRGTWGNPLRGLVDVRFFVGKEAGDTRDHVNLKSDEVMLGCPDDFMALPWKVKDICQWAVGKVYTHIFLCDNDTYVKPLKLMTSGFARYDYQGFFNRSLDEGTFDYHDVDPRGIGHHYQQCYPWASGGRGYFLSRSAFTLIAEKYPNQNEWAEDLWVGQLIGRRASIGELTINSVSDGAYSWHYPVERGYDPKGSWMYDMHKKYAKL